MVEIEPGTDADDDDALPSHPEAKRRKSNRRNGLLIYEVTPGNEAAMAAAFRQLPGVVRSEPDVAIGALFAPNDSSYSQQWAPNKIGLPSAWDVVTNTSAITIAIIDTGIDTTHPELAGRVLTGYDFVNDTSSANDDNGHGTHVAGIAAAAGNNAQGIAGIAWGAKLLPVKVLDAGGSGYVSSLIFGLDFARESGAKIANISLGSPISSTFLVGAVNRAATAGMLVVAAAGNSGEKDNAANYPAALSEVIAVAATDMYDAHPGYSTTGSYVTIAAPGTSILSTYKGGSYQLMSGTSMAAPHVSGFAALIWTKSPGLTAAEVRRKMEETAVDLGAAGKDPVFGSGRIDIGKWARAISGTGGTSPTSTPSSYPGPARLTPTPLPPTPAVPTPGPKTTLDGRVFLPAGRK